MPVVAEEGDSRFSGEKNSETEQRPLPYLRKGKMRKLFSALVSVLVLAFGTQQTSTAQSASLLSRVTTESPAGPVVNGLALSASTDKQVYVGGEAIILKVALTNPTPAYRNQVMIGSVSSFALFDYEARYADQSQVPLTAFGKISLKRVLGTHFDPFSVFILNIPPGKSLDYHVVISRLFDMSRGGTYQITVRWHDPSNDVVGQHNPKRLSAFVSNQAIVRVEEPTPEFYGNSGIIRR